MTTFGGSCVEQGWQMIVGSMVGRDGSVLIVSIFEAKMYVLFVLNPTEVFYTFLRNFKKKYPMAKMTMSSRPSS